MNKSNKRSSNKSNAQLSTGPHDTSRTRLNAMAHGILSKEVLITSGPLRESAKEFEEFKSQMMGHLAPLGPLEEFLVDQLVTSGWRMKRILKYECGTIRSQANEAIRRHQVLSRLSDKNLSSESPKEAEETEFFIASLPENVDAIQRYEAHLSRHLYKALHEFERLQAARLTGKFQVPLAVDIEVSGRIDQAA